MSEPRGRLPGAASEEAVEALVRLAAAPRCSDWGSGLTRARVSALLNAAHDHALGPDRSVRLGDVLDALRAEAKRRYQVPGMVDEFCYGIEAAADHLAREFSVQPSPGQEGE